MRSLAGKCERVHPHRAARAKRISTCAQCRAGGADIVHQKQSSAPRGSGRLERACHVAASFLGRGRSHLWKGRTGPAQELVLDRKSGGGAQRASQKRRLIEAPTSLAGWMERHRHDRVRSNTPSFQPHRHQSSHRLGQRVESVVLELVHQPACLTVQHVRTSDSRYRVDEHRGARAAMIVWFRYAPACGTARRMGLGQQRDAAVAQEGIECSTETAAARNEHIEGCPNNRARGPGEPVYPVGRHRSQYPKSRHRGGGRPSEPRSTASATCTVSPAAMPCCSNHPAFTSTTNE
jgi:hypothetical protein